MPKRPRPMPAISSGDIARFRKHVAVGPVDRCWLWTGCKCRGYGQFGLPGDGRYYMYPAHRVSLVAATSQDHADLYVCHSCDNPSCVNPNHLFWSTHQGNMQDAKSKGRTCGGERHLNSKLTNELVKWIRYTWKLRIMSQSAIARTLGVDSSVISDAVNRKTWKHIDEKLREED